ncbi:unnamed protein product [Toxocara canis]|uniref:HIT-type domain-containing protein n=1 Tax=Toxocara canis TaxID=6265 RepID=A0A3P7IQI8_TOXCA|nr:unnamed protein product [Toxocara canis]
MALVEEYSAEYLNNFHVAVLYQFRCATFNRILFLAHINLPLRAEDQKLRGLYRVVIFFLKINQLTFAYKASKTMEGTGWDAYSAARAPPSRYPPRRFCAVCGFFSNYTCIRCGARYCSVKCRDLHNDTRLTQFFIYFR